MNSRFKSWRTGLALTLPLIALLAGCNRGEKVEEPQTHALATYVSAPWEALPSVADEDLLAGFGAWRSACTRL
jgi:membrane-bound lytic murein transglycosylase A